MTKSERVKMVKSMEFIARQINDEEIFMEWVENGVADGDIEYGDLTDQTDENMEYYIESGNFADLMHLFLSLMNDVYTDDSGLYCDGVVDA